MPEANSSPPAAAPREAAPREVVLRQPIRPAILAAQRSERREQAAGVGTRTVSRQLRVGARELDGTAQA